MTPLDPELLDLFDKSWLGALTDEEHARATVLLEDPELAEQWNELTRIAMAFRSLRPRLPDGFADRLMARLRRLEAGQPRKRTTCPVRRRLSRRSPRTVARPAPRSTEEPEVGPSDRSWGAAGATPGDRGRS